MLSNLSIGFYEELKELHKEGQIDASFGFLENIDVGDYFYLYDFLHGHCDEFAAALSDYYGYKIEYILDSSNVLIHAYCTQEINGIKAYIDARGVTTDAELFFEEFADFCTYDNGRFYDLKGECKVLKRNNTCEMYNDKSREPNQDQDLVKFFKENNSYYDTRFLERKVENMKQNEKTEFMYVLTARSMWSDTFSQRSSFIDEAYNTLEEAKDKCREFKKSLASHMFAGIEEISFASGEDPRKTGVYFELVKGQFERRVDVKTLKDWPQDLTITQYLKVGDMVDNAMYEHFLNILPPNYYGGGVLQVGGACDTVKNEDGVLKPTFITFAKDNESDCWIFKGECFSHEWVNRNPDLESQPPLSLSAVPTEILKKMSEDAFSAYYKEATKPCGNWTPDMKFEKLEKATERLNEINAELERRLASNPGSVLDNNIKQAEQIKENSKPLDKNVIKDINKER